MGLKIWSSRYVLRFCHSRMRSRDRVRCGALLKIEDPQFGIGFADCHPWDTFGDVSLEKQLKLLARGKTTPLTDRSLVFARIDAAARAQRRNLFSDLTIPSSHHLVTHLEDSSPDLLANVAAQGFTRIKVKLDRDLEKDLAILETMAKRGEGTSVKLRLDFGERKRKDVERFLDAASPALLWKIDFIEDPVAYNGEIWEALSRTYPVRLARDRGVVSGALAGAQVAIIKPAIVNPIPIIDLTRAALRQVVVTSYLDHPLGQMTAAYAAAMAKRNFPGVVDTCGLLSHEVYEPNIFSESLRCDGPRLLAPEGMGFGFDRSLEKLKWEPLTPSYGKRGEGEL